MLLRALLVVGIVGCSASDHPPPGSGATTTTVGAGGGGGGDAGGDGGASTDPCVAIAQIGSAVPEVGIPGGPPSALGGAIAPGTYVLAEADAYAETADGGDAGETTGGGATGVKVRATLLVTASSIRRTGARGMGTLPADSLSVVSYVVEGTTLRATPQCPAAPATSIPYSAVGGGLALFVDASHRELYAPQ